MNNDIYTSGGADTAYTGRGDDHIRDFDSRPDRNVEFDTIVCGPGNDRVYTVEDKDTVSPDCEDITLRNRDLIPGVCGERPAARGRVEQAALRLGTA